MRTTRVIPNARSSAAREPRGVTGRIRGLGATAALVLALAAPLVCEAGIPGFALRGGVNGNGGNVGSSGTHVLHGTAGQAAVGVSDNAGHILCHGFWCFGGVRVVDVEQPDPGEALPDRLEFGQPTPNPAHGVVSFRLALPEAASVDFAVYDVQGRLVGRMFGGRLDPGHHRLEWEPGAGATGAGVYFARLLVDGRLIGQRRIVRMH